MTGFNKNIKTLTGLRFGRLLVINFVRVQSEHAIWKCLCDCGHVKEIKGASLRSGKTQSCGCLHRNIVSRGKHGHSRNGTSLTYNAWSNMKSRCLNVDHPSYKYYGGRGITVCREWCSSFQVFLHDMGERPSILHSIDRIDNSMGYYPGNCRWATKRQQQNNRRNNTHIVMNGLLTPLSYAAEQSGIKIQTLRSRLRIGWNSEKSISTPVKTRNKISCKAYQK